MTRFLNPIADDLAAMRQRLTRLEFAFEYEGEGSTPDAMEVSTLLTSISVCAETLERKCANELASYSRREITNL